MNFIIFQPDELRAESVGCYGHPLAPTPNIDAFAAQGTRFDQCRVQHSVCTPSRCSMMTGWYPHVRGHRTLWHLLRPHEPNLLKYLKQAGYTVLMYGKNDLLATASFADSVTEAHSHGKNLFGSNPYAFDDPRYYSFLYEASPGPLEEHSDYANVHAAINFPKSKPKQPFCLFLPLIFPHCPYSAPQPWHDRINPDDLPLLRPADLPNRPDFHALIRRYRRLDQLDATEQTNLLRKIQAVYLGMTSFIDHLLGQLLNALEDSGLADSTIVTFTSDHGDYAGDYGLVEKWPSAGEEVITRVPLLVRTPGGKTSHVVKEPVELFDLMATTLEQAGIKAEHTHFAQSYSAQLDGAAGHPLRAAFTEGGYARHETHCFEGRPDRDLFARDKGNIYYPKGQQQQEYPDSVGRMIAMRTSTHHLVYRPTGQCELYDLASDAQELYNQYDNRAYATVEHFQPASKGGSNELDNLVYACTTCNRFKATYWPGDDAPENLQLLHPGRENISVHIAELADGKLIGITERGWFHIQWLHLNRPQLVELRYMREQGKTISQTLQHVQSANLQLTNQN